MSHASRKQFRKKRKRRNRLKRFLMLVTVVFLGFLIYGGYVFFQAYQATQSAYEELERGEKSKLRTEVVKAGNDPVSILVMGIEDYATNGKNGRTDTLILITVDPKSKKMKMLSIPRDSRVEIIGRGEMDKITHAHAYGGTEMTINTVEAFLDIPVDYYIKINFDGFKKIIDELGGVTVNVPFDFIEKSTTGEMIAFKEGPARLNGEEALAYARMRKSDPRGDFGRTERQREIVKAAIDQAISTSTLFKVDEISEHLGENIQTNLKPSEIFALQKQFSTMDLSADSESLTIDGEDAYLQGGYYFIPDEESVQAVHEELERFLDQ